MIVAAPRTLRVHAAGARPVPVTCLSPPRGWCPRLVPGTSLTPARHTPVPPVTCQVHARASATRAAKRGSAWRKWCHAPSSCARQVRGRCLAP